jgi:hypothetical protein
MKAEMEYLEKILEEGGLKSHQSNPKSRHSDKIKRDGVTNKNKTI